MAVLSQRLEASGVDYKKRATSVVTDPETVVGLKSLLSSLKQHGVFVVPNGELESWLTLLGVTETANKNIGLQASSKS